MSDKIDIIRIQLDFLQGAIWPSDFETGEPLTGNAIVDNDEEIRQLNKTIGDLFTSYYEPDSHGQACWFNRNKERHDKATMLRLLGELNARLHAVNDGSFIVDDRETSRVRKL
ncbi:RNA helicase [Bifidobacterium jacchi]|uniref:RNA helicase n=1 Tax=Bifidobacterium jacchi TaxID=2490545 RepID=A0A5N5RJZ8_9BIFI|nr:RNA helicase [Bifidobacterium jacchi]KAB5607632.1 RNA helicase [Bifidobacterium jacchi]